MTVTMNEEFENLARCEGNVISENARLRIAAEEVASQVLASKASYFLPTNLLLAVTNLINELDKGKHKEKP